MILNSLSLFYLTSFRDYKKYWLKTILSLIGLILGLCLITTVQIYVDTIDYHIHKPDLLSNVYPKSYIVDQQSNLTTNDLGKIINSSIVSHGYPYVQNSMELIIQGEEYFCNIIGLDLIYVSSHLFKYQKDKALTFTGTLTDKVFILSDLDLNNKIESININNTVLKPNFILDTNQAIPLVVMDISLFQSVFKTNKIDRFYIESYQAKKADLSSFFGIKYIESSPPSQELSKAFFINLKFIGAFSIIISTLLVYLFFRFIQKHRKVTDVLLVNLGIRKMVKFWIRLFESLFFVSF